MKVHLSLIGMGTGNPDHITRLGVAALQRAQLVLVPRKGDDKADLAEVRLALCRELLPPEGTVVADFDMPVREGGETDYLGAVNRWHDAIALAWLDTLQRHLPAGGGAVALLVWGDPSLYDSSLRIAQRLASRVDLSVTVVPGITALQALTAAHAIPLNDINASVLITTGRQLRARGWPACADTVAVLLDGHATFQHLNADGLHIWWGAFLGMPHQLCFSGPLADVSATILREREQARARHGWVMDTYLLRRERAIVERHAD